MRAVILTLVSLMFLPLAALAQTEGRPNTILVLDASGSMWGQIDEVNKITIARDVIAEMLADIDDDVSLGLTVYGHRERGSCGDIETIVAPAPGTQDQILDAVNRINPRGRTPMTDAVVAAAQSLRSTEEAATVILVSDGIENCNPDPCSIAAELEAAGIDFTAHVIGFDVAAEPEARAQMQCIADNTGGQFLTADNAAELSEALEQVVAAQPTMMRIEAGVPPVFNMPTRPVTWTLQAEDGSIIRADVPGPFIEQAFLPGTYVAIATRQEPDGPQSYQTSFVVVEGMTDPVVVEMPALASEVSFVARIGDTGGVTITDPVIWEIDPPVSNPSTTNPASFMLQRGAYTVTAYWTVQEIEQTLDFVVGDDPREIVVVFPAPMPRATVTAPATAVAGSTIEVAWTGPNEPQDYIGIGLADADGSAQWDNFVYTAGGAIVDLVMPPAPGNYVIRYFLHQDRAAIAEVPITLTEAQASVTAPATAVAGSTIEVAWTGPNEPQDYIGIGLADADGSAQWENFVYTAEGAIVDLVMPPTPGNYVIRYFLRQDRTAIAEVPITVTEAQASLTAPATAVAGSTIEVAWTGPNEPQDYIGVGLIDAEGNDTWENFVYTEEGPIVDLVMPTTPGTYLIRYFLRQDRTAIAEVPITVTEAQASLTAPATAVAGSTIEVAWTGPNEPQDYIGVGLIDAEGNDTWENFVYTEEGPIVDLVMPTTPGTYLIRYFLRQDRTAIAEVPITVTPATATVTAPAMAVGGSTIKVGWTGPDYENDYIAIGRLDATGSDRWENFTRTEGGTPLDLQIPPAPGTYVIRYFEDQDRTILAEQQIEVSQAPATLTAPATAQAGGTMEVVWTGPNFSGDYLALGRAGADGSSRWETYTYTEDGSPLTISVPDTPGSYVLRYFIDQDRFILAEVPVAVQ